MSRPLPLPLAVGRALRDLRDAAGVSADEVARAARRLGLKSWHRSIVAGVESGRRRLTAEELLLLPHLLTDALRRPVSLPELLPAPIQLGATWADDSDLADLLAGHPATRELAGQRQASQEIKNAQVIAPMTPATTAIGDVHISEADIANEAEQIAARKLGVTARRVAVAAQHRWGRSLTSERDRLLAERGLADAPISSVRAIRGRITRNLVAELAKDVKNGAAELTPSS